MRHLDNDTVNEIIQRLNNITLDTVPKWGQLRRDTLIEHLIWVVKHSMGRSKQVPFFGNWFTRRIVGPAFLTGLFPIPKNLQLPKALSAQGIVAREPGDLNTLRILLEEYLALVQADELKTGLHPAFGDIGVDGWDRIHIMHFEHHLRQFGV
ncbi:MAG TPA: DUF1569 domain-containing protein [Candidatus Hydrogenedentes bacterium]|nr:DUF1569 domain-containing protein [Candidatus Hydrogenedentota bacterium]